MASGKAYMTKTAGQPFQQQQYFQAAVYVNHRVGSWGYQVSGTMDVERSNGFFNLASDQGITFINRTDKLLNWRQAMINLRS